MQTPTPGSSPTNYPRANLANDRQVLREVAISQRQIMYCILAQVALLFLDYISIQSGMLILRLAFFALALVLLVFMILSVIRLSKAVGQSPVVYVILMFIPCVSLAMLAMLSGKATTHLKKAGIKVGFLGADPNSI